MSFNWRLLLAPERVLEYVVWHEVCHLEILDHSPGFWALLGERWPRWREDRAWLRRNGALLVI
jgi:predicted metal-dependent hydrolase